MFSYLHRTICKSITLFQSLSQSFQAQNRFLQPHQVYLEVTQASRPIRPLWWEDQLHGLRGSVQYRHPSSFLEELSEIRVTQRLYINFSDSQQRLLVRPQVAPRVFSSPVLYCGSSDSGLLSSSSGRCFQ